MTTPFELSALELRGLLASKHSLLPELDTARLDIDQLRSALQTHLVVSQTESLMTDAMYIPPTSYTAYRRFRRDGDRSQYQAPYFRKRRNASAVALRLFLGELELKDLLQDYMWSICEESNWVVPASEKWSIDLTSAETGVLLAETLMLVAEMLDEEICHRVRQEVERRVCDPYLRFHASYGWYKANNNWNGVCNSSIAATFLLLEPDSRRQGKALELALTGLDQFLNTAFEQDGSSTEGLAYWHYGLINFVALSEMLYARSAGEINLLDSERVRVIASYPSKIHLSGAMFASFSDCDETVHLNPGIIRRLFDRTGEASLLNLVTTTANHRDDWRLSMLLRNILWWDGSQSPTLQPVDALLPAAGIARFVGRSAQGDTVVVAIKAGHNAENHNHDDVGSFIVHADGENLLTDPGPGLYSRQYFEPGRRENIFANSYGHSVPRIGGHLQGTGRRFHGRLNGPYVTGSMKCVEVELATAYSLINLIRARRQLFIQTQCERSDTIMLVDDFHFTESPCTVEEAFITWFDVHVSGPTATIQGLRHYLRITVEEPVDAQFTLVLLEAESKANCKPDILRRLSIDLPPADYIHARICMQVIRGKSQ
jgi:hypothetical protein